MDVGLAIIFQGTDTRRSDLEVYQQELRLGCMAESLGFQSIWGVEHHFTDYTMCPDVLQMLTYFAAQERHAACSARWSSCCPGTTRCASPKRSAMLDNLSNGRVILGLGRGLGRVEFEGFGVDMNASRDIFVESAQMILQRPRAAATASTTASYVKQVRRDIRPRPHTTFRGRTYAAAVSPESSRIMAELGVGLLHHPAEAVGHGRRRARRLPRASTAR